MGFVRIYLVSPDGLKKVVRDGRSPRWKRDALCAETHHEVCGGERRSNEESAGPVRGSVLGKVLAELSIKVCEVAVHVRV